MERTSWTDVRIDDMADRLDASINRLDASLNRLHDEMRDMRGEMRDMRGEMHVGFTSLRREMLYAVLAMSSVLVATMATILAKTL